MNKRRFRNFGGVYGESHADASPFYISVELIKARSESFQWKIEPHLHPNLHQFFLIRSGKVSIETATGHYVASSRSVICISPGSVHGFVFSPDIDGWVVSVSDAVVGEILALAPHMLLVINASFTAGTVESAALFDEIVELAAQIQHEHQYAGGEQEMAVRALLQLMLVKLYRVLSVSEKSNMTLSRNEQYFISFQQRMKLGTALKKSVKDYAGELNITPVHLNRICQHVSGKSASWLIQAQVVREAQRLLRYTTHSIAEIAYQLNFTTPGYFSRLFKKHTGKTPEAYRKM